MVSDPLLFPRLMCRFFMITFIPGRHQVSHPEVIQASRRPFFLAAFSIVEPFPRPPPTYSSDFQPRSNMGALLLRTIAIKIFSFTPHADEGFPLRIFPLLLFLFRILRCIPRRSQRLDPPSKMRYVFALLTPLPPFFATNSWR